MKKSLVLLVGLAVGAGAYGRSRGRLDKAPRAPEPKAVLTPFTPAELKGFSSLAPIDTHAHVYATNSDFVAMLQRLNVHILDICLDDDQNAYMKDLPREIHDARQFIAASHGHASFCTSFNPFRFAQPDFDSTAIRQLNQNFAEGAIAVKIWKNIGIELKDSKGNYVMPDDPVFEPIYKDIAAHGKTLVAHLAEPNSCWRPLNPASPDYWYYTHNPQWYMYGKKGAASKEAILRARDHLVEENPNLRVVGAHLGSLESNFDELGRDFDRYPNFAVDMAARMPYVMMLPRARAIAFIEKYQDRLIYGTDLDFGAGANPQETIKTWEESYARDWRFLATKDTVEYLGKKYQGLDLPRPVLEKIYHANAVRWFPGILGRE